MNKQNNLLSYIIYFYIIFTAILPSKFRIGPVPLNGDIIFLLICLIYLGLIIVNLHSRRRFVNGLKDFFKDYLSIFMILLLLVMVISVSYAVYKPIALKESARFLSYIILFFIIKYEINEKRVYTHMIKSYIFVCSFISIFGIVQYFTKIGLGSEFIYNTDNYSVAIRIASTLENPNSLGAFLVLAIFPLIMITIYEKNKNKRILYAVISIISFVNILLSSSRNAWLGIAFGFGLLILLYNWRAIFLFIVGGVVIPFIPFVRNRLRDFDLKGIMEDGRVKLWKAAVKMIKDHPILGIGNGNYFDVYEKYVKMYPDLSYNGHTKFPVHNSYLKIYSELGIAGIVTFMGFLLSILFKIKNFIYDIDDEFYKAFYKGFFISVIVFYFMNISDNLLFVPKVSTYFWILVAISQSMLYNNSRDFVKYNVK